MHNTKPRANIKIYSIIQKKVKKRKKYTKNRWDKWNTNNKMVDLNPNILVITSSVNCLNTPIQRPILSAVVLKIQQNG